MIIEIDDLLKKKVSIKDVHLVYEEENFYDDGESIVFLKPITLEGELKITGDIISLDGSIYTELDLSCSRCLANFNHDVDIQIHEEFSNNSDNKDDEIIFIDGDTIDITNIVKNNIILSLPIQKLCKDDCKGLCQNCGENFNTDSCNCDNDDIDPRLAKLKDLFSAD